MIFFTLAVSRSLAAFLSASAFYSAYFFVFSVSYRSERKESLSESIFAIISRISYTFLASPPLSNFSNSICLSLLSPRNLSCLMFPTDSCSIVNCSCKNWMLWAAIYCSTCRLKTEFLRSSFSAICLRSESQNLFLICSETREMLKS